ncbi:hypothetical protein ACLKA6_001759 [Drosophila palustris]
MDFKAKKRALAATNVTIAALLAAYYLLKEQEEEEAQERKRSHWVNPYLLERRTKGRYETSFPKWDKENMLKWSEEFEKQWNFPNCIGAIDT